MASIAPDDALILPHCANPRRMEFSGTTSGWWFFLTDQASERSLRSVRRDYIDAMAVDAQDDEPDDDVDEDEV
jgi:hypothetical protein